MVDLSSSFSVNVYQGVNGAMAFQATSNSWHFLMYPLDWLKIFTGNHGFSPWEIYRFRKHRSAAWVMARLVAHFREDLGCPAGKKSNKWGLHQAN
jgi:hypothetical protein